MTAFVSAFDCVVSYRPNLRVAAPLEGLGSNSAVEDHPHGSGQRFQACFCRARPSFRPYLRLFAARLRCLACVDGPVLDRVHVFLHVRPRFVVQFVHQSCCACCGNAGGCPHGRYNRFMEQKHPRVVILTLVPNLYRYTQERRK